MQSDRLMARDTEPADECIKLVSGLAFVFALFQGLGHILHSDRGQAGLVIAAAVVAALLAVEVLLFRRSLAAARRCLGLGRPSASGLTIALALSGLLVLVMPAYAAIQGASLAPYPGWAWLLPGLFAQAGIAEEALFRGYLFHHLRRGRAFWQAAMMAAVPFVAVHLIMFATLPWPVALASLLLATVMSFPLAYLFELGGNTIWAPALLHFTVQGAIKVFEVPGDATLPFVWIAASAAIPYLAFLFRRPSHLSEGDQAR